MLPMINNKIERKGDMAQNSKRPEFEWHPVACMFPIPQGPEFDAMVEDLKQNGLRENGTVWIDSTGKIWGVDGRFREKACDVAGVEFSYEPRKFRDESRIVAYILSRNLARRHMNESQRAILGARLLPMFAEEAQKRKTAGKQVVADLPDGQKGRAREHVAALLNVSDRLIQDAKTLLENNSPELIQRVESGENTVSAVLEILKNLSEEEQKNVLAGGPKAVREAAAQVRKDKKAAKATPKGESKEEQPAPTGKQAPPAPTDPSVDEEQQSKGVQSTPEKQSVEAPPQAVPPTEVQIPEWVAALPERIRKGFEKHLEDLPKIESIRITCVDGEKRYEIGPLTVRKGNGKPPKPDSERPVDNPAHAMQPALLVHAAMVEEANKAAGNKKYEEEELTEVLPVWSSVNLSTEVLGKILKAWGGNIDIEGMPKYPTVAFICEHYNEMKAAVRA
jgi:hypothetical protein